MVNSIRWNQSSHFNDSESWSTRHPDNSRRSDATHRQGLTINPNRTLQTQLRRIKQEIHKGALRQNAHQIHSQLARIFNESARNNIHLNSYSLSITATLIKACERHEQTQEMLLSFLAKQSWTTEVDQIAIATIIYQLKHFDSTHSDVDQILSKLLPTIQACHQEFSGQVIGNALYGLQRLTDSPKVRQILQVFALKIQASPVELSDQNIGNALYGLQNLADSPEVRQVLHALAFKIQASPAELSGQAIGNALYGLKNLSDSPEIRQVLRALAIKIQASSAELSGQEIGSALYGLQGLIDSPEVRQILQGLVLKIQASSAKLSEQEIGNALYGLQNLPDSPEVRQVVHALAFKIQASPAELSGQAIGNALYGLQSLVDSPEVRQVLHALALKIQASSAELSEQEIGNALYGLQGLTDSPEVRQVLHALALKIQASSAQLSGQAIGNTLYGLQSLTDSPEVRQVLHALALKINTSSAELSSQNISNALYGLKNLPDCPEVRQVLHALALKIQASSAVLLGQEIGNALYGFKNLSDSSEVRQVLQALALKIQASSAELSGQEIGNALYGLKNLTESPEVRQVLHALALKIQTSPAELSEQHIGNALYGLQNLTDSPEVRQVLHALTLKIQASSAQLSGQAISTALYGLKNLPDSSEVRQVLRALVLKIQANSECLSAQQIGNALYGLQGLTGSPEVRQVLKALTPKIQACSESLLAQHIGNSLYGLKNLTDSPEVRQILQALVPKIQTCSESLLAQHVSNSLYGLKNLTDSPEVRQILQALAPKIQACIEHLSAQQISSALYGLKNLTDSPEVRQVLQALVPKIQACPERLFEQAIGNALYGLQSLTDSPEVRQVLHALALKIQASSAELSAQAISNALYGLKNLTDSLEVRQVLHALALKIQVSSAELSGQAIGNALYNLQNLTDSSEVRQFLQALVFKIQASSAKLSAQEIGSALYGLKNLSDSPEIRQVLRALAIKIQASSAELSEQAIGNALYGLQNLTDSPEIRQVLAALCSKINTYDRQCLYMALVGVRHLQALDVIQPVFNAFLNANPQTEIDCHTLFQADMIGVLSYQPMLAEAKLQFLRTACRLNDDQFCQLFIQGLRLSGYRQLLQWQAQQFSASGQSSQPLIQPLIQQLVHSVQTSQTDRAKLLNTLANPLSEDPMPSLAPIPAAVFQTERALAQEKRLKDLTAQTHVSSSAQVNQLRNELHASYGPRLALLNPTCTQRVEPTLLTFNAPASTQNNRAKLLILLPTRGKAPDVSISSFLLALNKSLNQLSDWNPADIVRVIVGVNGQDQPENQNQDLHATIQRLDDELKKLSGLIQHHIQVQRLGFSWSIHQTERDIVPFGEIRNFCFDQIDRKLISKECRFISMDADTKMTPQALNRILQLEANQFTTLAYQIPESVDSAQWGATYQAFDLHWEIQSKVQVPIKDGLYNIAYPAEPCLAMGPQALKSLILKRLKDQEAIYGVTDCEGRFLSNHLRQSNHQFVPVAKNQEVSFHNYERFKVIPSTLQDTPESFRHWLSSLAGQSQNMLGQDFFTRQLAFSLRINSANVLPITKELYLPKLIDQGFSLLDALTLIAQIKAQRKQHSRSETVATSSQSLIDQKANRVIAHYQQLVQMYGREIAKVVLLGSLKWLKTTVQWSQKQYPDHSVVVTSRLQGQPNRQATLVENSSVDLQQASGSQGYLRQNTSLRMPYPKVQVATQTRPAMSSVFNKVALPEGTSLVLDKIPRKRRLQSVSESSPVFGIPVMAATKKIRITSNELAPRVEQQPTQVQPEWNPRVSGNVSEFTRAFEEAMDGISSRHKDLFNLLDDTHFNGVRILRLSELKTVFCHWMMDRCKDLGIHPEQLTAEHLQTEISDLLLSKQV